MIGVTTKRYSSTSPSSIRCEGTSTPPTKIFLPCSCFSLSISSRRSVRTILVFLSSALPNDREKTILLRESNVRANSFSSFVSDCFFCDIRPIRNHQLVGFTPIDEQASIISQEARVVFHYLFIRNVFGVVAAAVEGNVDCEDYISHLIYTLPVGIAPARS